MTSTLAPPSDPLLDADPLAEPGAPAISDGRARRFTTHGSITALIGAVTAALYFWNLNAVGYANTYYTAAVKSASVSWKAMFFGSIDPGNFITVDKPPAALWIQGLSARIFGFSTFSMILPEVLCGIGSVLLLHHLVRKWRGDVAAHLAAIALAITPIAVAMFRNNNPDAFLTLLGLAAAWGMWRALETGRTRFLVAAAAFTGLAFQAKMLQAFLVLPAFILVYLIAGPPKLGKRFLQLLAALGTLIVAGGWWYAIVALWPASSRPFIGSTTDNSIVSLLLGYNGLDRVFGGSTGTPGAGGGGGPNFGGTTGWSRLFNTQSGGLISWFFPMALAGLLAGLWLTRTAARTDKVRAGWILWGMWALTCWGIFSYSSGIFHPYYEVQLAPAVAALAGAGGVALWQLGKQHRAMLWALPATVVLTATLAVGLLRRASGYATWLSPTIVAGAALAAAALVAGAYLGHKVILTAGAAVAAVTLLAAPAAYSLTAVQHPVSGSIVTAGPTTSGSGGFGGGAFPGGSNAGPGGGTTTGRTGMGGESSSVDSALITYLLENKGDATYIAAGMGSQTTAPIIIATGEPVMTIGGFGGSDPAPTLAEFQQMVADGEVRFLITSGGFGGGLGGGPGGGRNGSSEISTWAASVGTTVTVGNTTLIDLSGAA